ncbi:hypothetical protein [Natrarchaeobaculum aegyptiacum]|uniref:Metal-dependent hydrolase n=1 Tax=Natrarchaeobaculum aegyptiacum TaxID=745377 RepID=A0A2Z2HS81_9EURY|nr:hypothetical protein [Natrarchaeobaculum aegyptiacum]ARS89989.1 hypothetical protein B1756_09790 [Natrarchaeobaculum aegyptiacum]
MVTTHALVGLLIALPVVFFAPDHAPVALAAGVAGGILPDFDVVATHRKTFHAPVVAAGGAIAALPLALLSPSALTIALAVFLAAAALHCYGDVLSCGLGARPWENPPSDRAVFDHVRGRWVPPRRVIPYDGSPEDLAIAGVLAVPLLFTLEGQWELLVSGLLVVSIGYTVSRKRLEHVACWGVRFLPAGLRRYVPERYLV